jgi:DNA-binding response OmpR family regulator
VKPLDVLLLEDDLELGPALVLALERGGLAARWIRLVATAKEHLVKDRFSLAVLDIGLPDGSGLELLTWIRSQRMSVPVIMLTARSNVADRVHALDNGADDYLPKPFAFEEFLSRARALIRRGSGFSSRILTIRNVRVDIEAHLVWKDGVEVELSPSEFSMLSHLMSRLGRVLTRANIEQSLGMIDGQESNVIEVHVHHLRRKLGAELIRTVRGVGYVIDPPIVQ